MVLRSFIYYLSVFFLFCIRFIPYNLLVNLGGFLSYFYFKISKDKKQILQNLHTAFPEKSDEEIEKNKNDFAVHLGKSLCEFLGLKYLNQKRFLELFEFVGKENLDVALKNGKGVILLTGHVGNWEFVGAYLASIGYPINVVAKKIYDERLNDILVSMRRSKGVNSLLRTESTKDMIKVLKNNECLGILIDQDTKVKGCFVNFFGKSCFTPIGATVMAMKYDAVVVPVFARRIENNRHLIQLHKPVELQKTDDAEDDIIKNTQKFNDIIENQIRKYPAQWVWIHKRWKTPVALEAYSEKRN
jgi:KDO2-lipid IV(A) lauroyltransferase